MGFTFDSYIKDGEYSSMRKESSRTGFWSRT